MNEQLDNSLLAVRELQVAYGEGADRVLAVNGVSLEVGKGETVALVGESGSGKSTVAHAIAGILPNSARIEAGTIDFNGTDLTRLNEKALRRIRGQQIGFVPQDPMMALNPVQRIGDQVAEAIALHIGPDAGKKEIRERALEALSLAGFKSPQDRWRQYPFELSGGMRQRVLIAIAISCNPQLIIADEPTSALDVTVQRRILDHLDSMRSQLNVGVLLITHDLSLAMERSDRLVVMSNAMVQETGDVERILSAPTSPYTRHLLSSTPSLASEPLITQQPTAAADVLLSVEGLSKTFKIRGLNGKAGLLQAAQDVSFSIPRGSTLGLVGESGSGKTTVARMVMRMETPTAGKMTFEGTDITNVRGKALRDYRKRMQAVYQSPFASLDPLFEVGAIIEEPLRAYGIGSRSERLKTVHELLDRVALPRTLINRRPRELSGGQRQRVSIARALALRPSLVVADEPVSALDVSVQSQVLELLVELRRDLGLSYLFISHDLAVVRLLCDDVVIMQDGRLVEAGRTEEVFASPQHPYTQNLIDSIPGRRLSV